MIHEFLYNAYYILPVRSDSKFNLILFRSIRNVLKIFFTHNNETLLIRKITSPRNRFSYQENIPPWIHAVFYPRS